MESSFNNKSNNKSSSYIWNLKMNKSSAFSNQYIQNKITNSSPYYGENLAPNPLIQRSFIPINPPKFGRKLKYIDLPTFEIGSESTAPTKFELTPKNKPFSYEREISLELYLNTSKIRKKLVYSKIQFEKDSPLSTDNIIDLQNETKEKKKKSKTKESFEINKENFDSDENILNFESKFESGNLQLAYLPEKNKYNLFLHNDTNTTGYTQWFFFLVKNGKKNQKVNFNILNLRRRSTKYMYGLKVWYYSTKKNGAYKSGWEHTKEEVQYGESFIYGYQNQKRKTYGRLSFDYTFEYDDDTVYFANCVPYTYSMLMKDLAKYQKYENTKYPFFTRKTLCSTHAGNDVDYIIINNSDIEYNHTNQLILNRNKTNNKNKVTIERDKKVNSDKTREGIIMIARQHPSETVGSWVIKGAIDFLMSECDEAKYLRDSFVFRIIPMMNPDGVISGNTRTSFAGCDLNRRWSNPSPELHQEIFKTKEMIMNFSSQRKVSIVIDFHGHFGAFNSFFYCNYDKDNFRKCKLFPFILANNSGIIELEKCRFSMPRSKNGTGRIALFKELQVENILCLETSNFGCLSKKYLNQYFTPTTLMEIGRDVCLGILYYDYYNKNKNGINTKILSSDAELKLKDLSKEIESSFNKFIEDKISLIEKKKKIFLEEGKKVDEESIESFIDKEANSDEAAENDDLSESEPSEDNIDEQIIYNLIPRNKKCKKVKNNKKKGKNLIKNLISSITRNHDNSLSSKIVDPLPKKQVSLPKLIVNSQTKSLTSTPSNNETKISKSIKSIPKLAKSSKNDILDSIEKISNTSSQNNNEINKNNYTNEKLPKHVQIKNKNNVIEKIEKNDNINNIVVVKVDSEAQTEEIYFKMHWSYFVGMCNILSANYYINPINNYRNLRAMRNFNFPGSMKHPLNNFCVKGFNNNINMRNKIGGKFEILNSNNNTSKNGNENSNNIYSNYSVHNSINNLHKNNNQIVQGYFLFEKNKNNINSNLISNSLIVNSSNQKMFKSSHNNGLIIPARTKHL